MKRLLSVFLVIILIVSLAVGAFILYNAWIRNLYAMPEGYTGGFKHYYGQTKMEYYWVETYDECIAAIEKLESHGSKINKSLILSEEREGMDVKYCFQFTAFGTDSIVFGEDPFDRYSGNVTVDSFIFYEDVEIDELVYSYVTDYNYAEVAYISTQPYLEMLNKYPDATNEDFEVKYIRMEYFDESGRGVEIRMVIYYKDCYIYETWYYEGEVSGISEEDIRSVVKSVVLVGN